MKTNIEQVIIVIIVMGPRILVGCAESREHVGQGKLPRENRLSQNLKLE